MCGSTEGLVHVWDVRSARREPTQSVSVSPGAKSSPPRVLHATWFPEAPANGSGSCPRARIATLCTNRQFGVHTVELLRRAEAARGPRTRGRGVGAYVAPPAPPPPPSPSTDKSKHKRKHKHKAKDKDKGKGKGKGKGKRKSRTKSRDASGKRKRRAS